MPGGSRLARGQESVDPRQHRAVAGLDPLVLSLVVIPRADDEQLGEQLWVVQITVQVPVHGAGPPAQPPQLDGRRQKLLIGSGRKPVADRDRDGALLHGRRQLRQRQRIGGQQRRVAGARERQRQRQQAGGDQSAGHDQQRGRDAGRLRDATETQRADAVGALKGDQVVREAAGLDPGRELALVGGAHHAQRDDPRRAGGDQHDDRDDHRV